MFSNFTNFPDKRLKWSLFFMLRFHFIFNYLQFKCKEAVVQWCSVRKVFFKNFTKFTEKYLFLESPFNNVVGLQLATLLKKQHTGVFLSVIWKNWRTFYRTPLDKHFPFYCIWILLILLGSFKILKTDLFKSALQRKLFSLKNVRQKILYFRKDFLGNNSYCCKFIFPEADPKTLLHLRWSALKQFLTACRH